MRATWRNIQNVTRFGDHINTIDKRRDLQQPRVRTDRLQTGVWHADTPMPLALALNDKYIILVQMRTDTTAWCGVADHQIVYAPVRNKPKRLNQLRCFRVPVIDRLHQPTQPGPRLLVLLPSRELAQQVAEFVGRLRSQPFANAFQRAPGIAESVEWAKALVALDTIVVDPEVVSDTAGILFKQREDVAALTRDMAAQLLQPAEADA